MNSLLTISKCEIEWNVYINSFDVSEIVFVFLMILYVSELVKVNPKKNDIIHFYGERKFGQKNLGHIIVQKTVGPLGLVHFGQKICSK